MKKFLIVLICIVATIGGAAYSLKCINCMGVDNAKVMYDTSYYYLYPIMETLNDGSIVENKNENEILEGVEFITKEQFDNKELYFVENIFYGDSMVNHHYLTLNGETSYTMQVVKTNNDP